MSVWMWACLNVWSSLIADLKHSKIWILSDQKLISWTLHHLMKILLIIRKKWWGRSTELGWVRRTWKSTGQGKESYQKIPNDWWGKRKEAREKWEMKYRKDRWKTPCSRETQPLLLYCVSTRRQFQQYYTQLVHKLWDSFLTSWANWSLVGSLVIPQRFCCILWDATIITIVLFFIPMLFLLVYLKSCQWFDRTELTNKTLSLFRLSNVDDSDPIMFAVYSLCLLWSISFWNND